MTLVRLLSIDPIVVRQNWPDAHDYTTDKGAAANNDHARVNDPFARIGKESVTVDHQRLRVASDGLQRALDGTGAYDAAAGLSGGRRW